MSPRRRILIKVPVMVYLEPDQDERLENLCSITGVKKTAYMRLAIEHILDREGARYAPELQALARANERAETKKIVLSTPSAMDLVEQSIGRAPLPVELVYEDDGENEDGN